MFNLIRKSKRKGFIIPFTLVVFLLVISLAFGMARMSTVNAKNLGDRSIKNSSYYSARNALEGVYAYLTQAAPAAGAAKDYVTGTKMKTLFLNTNGSNVFKDVQIKPSFGTTELFGKADVKIYWYLAKDSNDPNTLGTAFAGEVDLNTPDTYYYAVVAKGKPLNVASPKDEDCYYMTMIIKASDYKSPVIYDGDLIGKGVN